MSGAIHGGALWQPCVRIPEDYASVVAADVNDAWYPPAPAVMKALARWARHSNHSPDTSGGALARAVAGHFAIPEPSVRIGAGASDLLHHFILSTIGPGDEMLTLSPSYAEYARVAKFAGARVKRLRLNVNDAFEANPGAILAAVGKNTRLISLCNPNNPTGQVLNRPQMLEVMQALPKRTFLLVDEAYIDFAPEESVLADAPLFPNIAVVRTFSKAYAMAGLRVGFAVLGSSARKRFDRNARPPWPVSLLGLHAAEAALADSDYVARRVAETLRLKADLLRNLRAPSLPSATHYFLLDLQTTEITANRLDCLRSRNIFLRDFAGFTAGSGKRLSQRFVRITTQSRPANRRIAQEINRIISS
jgi:histidinol-phosphate/aromatic aminotransferase/cobyric acid decarboxylase-like protein